MKYRTTGGKTPFMMIFGEIISESCVNLVFIPYKGFEYLKSIQKSFHFTTLV